MLNLKKDHNGNVVRDVSARPSESFLSRRDVIPMKPRFRFRVCVVGGGIAGLTCCLELLRQFENEKIDAEVVLLEGQNRLGGRLWTDRDTFKSVVDGTPLPVDLGASWIHGIVDNPLAVLAKEAKVEFLTTSEDVIMLQAGTKMINAEKDEYAGVLFDKFLDIAVS